MSNVFGDYSRYYDLLYKDKDYGNEVHYLRDLIQRFAPQTQTILNLGCGTGAHDFFLSEYGYSIDGIDVSQEMLSKAIEKAAASPKLSSLLRFYKGDIRSIRLDKTFDVALSLFHVMSYQTSNNDFMDTLSTVKYHLNPNGIFIFDCWYGPAVLTDRPTVRVKRLEDDLIKVIRIAEPSHISDRNLVDVNYTVFVTEKKTGVINVLNETHTMRYLFLPEIEFMLSNNGFKILAHEEWITKKTLGFDTWSALFICQMK
ncbi:class I SAM-dependent methyltransferase [bacterium]|nr:class I SAM-dependent methyltransferase [bacterium]NUN46093.1 class I SAM-dependent methyltransferase [bacterium]